MPSSLTRLKVFIASPGGLAEERKAFRDEIHEFNEADAIHRGVFFQPIGWEDTLGGIGRPQAIINEDVMSSDYFLLLLWDRWGTPPARSPSRFSSGTEEEFSVAVDCFRKKRTMRQIVILFKSVPPHQLSDPGAELQKVLQFRKEIEQGKEHLFHGFDTTQSFRKLLRRHLASWLRHEENGTSIDKFRESVINNPDMPEDDISPLRVSPNSKAQDPRLLNAWELAENGKLTEAEVEFARTVIGSNDPRVFLEYGRFLYRVGRLTQAKLMFESAVSAGSDQGQEAIVGEAYTCLGNIQRIQGNYLEAQENHKRAIELCKQINHAEGLAKAYGNLGTIYTYQGDLDSAEEMYRKSLELNESLENVEGIAIAKGNLGILLKARGKLEAAEKMYRDALQLGIELGKWESVGAAYINLGVLMKARGDVVEAEEMLKKAVEVETRLGRSEGLAIAFGNLGALERNKGNFEEAERMHRRSLELNEALGRVEGIVTSYTQLGRDLLSSADHEAAEDMFRRGLEVSEKHGLREEIARCYFDLGLLEAGRKNLKAAEEMYGKALAIADELSLTKQASATCNNLGIVLGLQGRFEEEEQMYWKALDLSLFWRHWRGATLAYCNLGISLLKRGEREAARKALLESIEAAKKANLPDSVARAEALLEGINLGPHSAQEED